MKKLFVTLCSMFSICLVSVSVHAGLFSDIINNVVENTTVTRRKKQYPVKKVDKIKKAELLVKKEKRMVKRLNANIVSRENKILTYENAISEETVEKKRAVYEKNLDAETVKKEKMEKSLIIHEKKLIKLEDKLSKEIAKEQAKKDKEHAKATEKLEKKRLKQAERLGE